MTRKVVNYPEEVSEMWCPLNVEKRASKAQENGENVRNKNRA